MARADVIMGSPSGSSGSRSAQSSYLVINSAGDAIYNFMYSGVDNGLYWHASYDNGFTWTRKILIKAISSPASFAVWYRGWTPGGNSDVIDIYYFDVAADDVYHRTLTISTEALGTETVIFAGASTGAVANSAISGVCAIGGNLYCAFDIDGGTETGFYRSVDSGANWTSRTNVNEAASTDYYYLAPGFAADTQDIICIFWDRSASEISRKIYDDSANSWAETSIAGSMTSIPTSTSAPQFAISVDDANNKILLVAWSNRDLANADLRYWYLDESSITEGTNVVLNSGDDQQMCALSLVASSGLLYCFYGGKSDGSETAGTSVHIYYKTSSDNGATWGSETKLSTQLHNYDFLYTVPVILDTNGKFYAAYELQALTIDEMLISVELPSGGGGVATPMCGGGVIQ